MVRVAQVIRDLGADVVGLQEVGIAERGGGQLARLATLTGLVPVAGPLHRSGGDWRGNGLLTRYPAQRVRRHDLSVGRGEPRGIIDVTLEAGASPVRVLVTHFGLRARERRRQVEILVRALLSDRAPVLALLGDFNEWWPRSETIARLNALMGRAPARRTFPARWPLLALDRIWVAPPESVSAAGVHRTPLARGASDHLPVWCDVRMPS